MSTEPAAKVKTLISVDTLDEFIRAHPIAVVYFSGPDCAVCGVLKPKLLDLLIRRFPGVPLGEVDCAACPAPAAQQGVFTIPTLVVYLDGREGLRKVRNFSLREVEEALARSYAICFGAAP